MKRRNLPDIVADITSISYSRISNHNYHLCGITHAQHAQLTEDEIGELVKLVGMEWCRSKQYEWKTG